MLRASGSAGRSKRDLIQQTAYSLLVLRVVEGLAAWVLFNEVFLPVLPGAWPYHFFLLLYFIANSILVCATAPDT